MKKSLIQNLIGWIEHLNNYPGCDQKMLNVRVQLWASTAYALFHVLVLTFAFQIFAPEILKTLINYGYFLIIILTSSLFLAPRIRKYMKLTYTIQLIILLAGTFLTIMHLGGIATSGGLIVVCLALIICSVPLQDSKISFLLFLLFTAIAIFSGLSNKYLQEQSPLPPKFNAILFTINTLSMSGFSFYLVLVFIRQQHALDEMTSKHLKEINEARNKLFTNITHEFRTPLTVILGMADLIEKNSEEWLKEGTQKIKTNSNVLLNLVNQMLDLAKIEAGKLSLNCTQGNINSFIGYIAELFGSLAQSHGIRLVCRTANKPFIMDFDADKLLHVISNLLSNAIKYTPGGGTIEITTSIEEHQKWFSIQVKDNGTGILPEHLPHIFDRFFHVEHESHFQQGTGLGLSMAKELVELMNGRISVQSKAGHGSVFTVELPVTHEAILTDFENPTDSPNHIRTFFPKWIEPLSAEHQSAFLNKNLPLLLIVEDSPDVSNYLAAIMKNKYRIEHAENGKAGLEKAINYIPDVILSDVMMPVMDGIELLEKVKNDMRTSHIPVVLLTAKADVASRITGLERGADAYLTKPFDENELHVVLKSLVEIRRKLQERYSSPDKFPSFSEPVYQKEDEFMSKVRHVMEDNLEDDEFGISQLCLELSVSHTQLYRKFKSLSTTTISDYLKSLRLQQARKLLLSTKLNVTEVAFSSGFKNLSHFSREFSAAFGVSPNDFRKNPNLGFPANN